VSQKNSRRLVYDKSLDDESAKQGDLLMSTLPEITKPLSIFDGPYYLSIAGKLVQSKDSFDVVNPAFRADVTFRPVSKLKLTSGR
jgi:hypothetical protein